MHAKIRDVYDMGDEKVLQEINDNDLIRPEVDDSDDIIGVTILMENILPHGKDNNVSISIFYFFIFWTNLFRVL